MTRKFKEYFKNPALIYETLGAHGLLKCMSDEKYLKKLFKIRIGKKLDLENPKTFNEKLQWLKIHARKPEYTEMTDKVLAKNIVAEKIGEEYIIPTLGVYDKFSDINFDALPEKFVIKCTHDSGSVIVVKDKNSMDKLAIKKRINKRLKLNYFNLLREWPYKNVKPKIIVEKYLEHDGDLPDYKFFCFDGKVKALYVATGRPYDTRFDFFDENFNFLPFINGHPNADVKAERPANFEKMKILAEKLSAGLAHVRIDLYSVNGRIYFGEFTFFHMSGLTPFKPEEWDYKFGEWLTLPKMEENKN